MTPIGPDHATGVAVLVDRLVARPGERAAVRGQSPLRRGDLSEPEPDVTVLVPPHERYRHRRPVAEDVLLLIEVSSTGLRFDRQRPPGVAEVWIVDLAGETVEVYRQPSAEGYGAVELHGRGQTVSPADFPDVELSVDELLG